MPKREEEFIQMAVMQYLRMHHRTREVAFHPANERKTSPQHGAKLKAMGVLAGVSDIVLPIPTKLYHGLFLELKAPGGKLTATQKLFLKAVNAQGYLGVVAYSTQEAINVIDNYLRD